MKDSKLNLTPAERGIRAFLVITGAFLFSFTTWFVLIPVIYYLWLTALAGHCIVKAGWTILDTRLHQRTVANSNKKYQHG